MEECLDGNNYMSIAPGAGPQRLMLRRIFLALGPLLFTIIRLSAFTCKTGKHYQLNVYPPVDFVFSFQWTSRLQESDDENKQVAFVYTLSLSYRHYKPFPQSLYIFNKRFWYDCIDVML